MARVRRQERIDAASAPHARDISEADAAARAAVADARELGYTLLAAEARVVLSEVRAMADARDAMRDAAGELAALAESMASARFAADARWFTLLATSGPLAPALLAALTPAPSPPTARRAAALLGMRATLSHIDAAIVAVARARCCIVRREAAISNDSPGWGIDEHRRAVWLADGTTIDLSKSPVAWQCLESLAGRPSGMSKDELVPILWEGEAYNPARHDNRLHPLINKLRKAIEDDPARPDAESFSRLTRA